MNEDFAGFEGLSSEEVNLETQKQLLEVAHLIWFNDQIFESQKQGRPSEKDVMRGDIALGGAEIINLDDDEEEKD